MRIKLRPAIKNKDSGYDKTKRESKHEIMRKLGTIRGPQNLRTSMTSWKQNLTRNGYPVS